MRPLWFRLTNDGRSLGGGHARSHECVPRTSHFQTDAIDDCYQEVERLRLRLHLAPHALPRRISEASRGRERSRAVTRIPDYTGGPSFRVSTPVPTASRGQASEQPAGCKVRGRA